MAKLYIKRFGGYMMHSFMNDYSEGAHPRILELLVKSNFQQNKGTVRMCTARGLENI